MKTDLATPIRSWLPYQWELVGWFWLAFFLNQADRQVFSVVLPALQADLRLTDLEAGLVASIFTACLGLAVPFGGYIGDAFSKKRIVVLSLFGWSFATLLTGFSSGMISLVLVRSVATGVGEAFYAPSANALIGEYHEKTRALALAIHQTSVYAGVVASGALAGYLADVYGWRASFWVFGAAGVLLTAGLARRVRGRVAVGRPEAAVSVRSASRFAFRTPTVLLLAAAFAGMIFVNIGYLTWMPTYLHERFRLSLASAGFASMFYHHACALLGVIAGGRLSDRFASRRPRVRLEIQALGLLLGAPFLWLLGTAGNQRLALFALAGFGFCRGVYDSNIYAGLYEVVPPRFRCSAAALLIAFGFSVGALAPVMLGSMKHSLGLASGFSLLSVVYVGAAMITLAGASVFFEADRARAFQ